MGKTGAKRSKYLTVQDVADELGRTRGYVYDRIADGTIPALYEGDEYRVDPADLDTYLEQCRAAARERVAARKAAAQAEGHAILSRGRRHR